MIRYCFHIIVFLSFTAAFSQSDKIEEKKTKLTCDEILKLKELAATKFSALKGEKDVSIKKPNSDSYFSKQSFGIEGSTRIVIAHEKVKGVVHDSPAIEFTLHSGINSQSAELTYFTLIVELDNCIKRLDFDKEVDIKRGRDPLTDSVKEVSQYTNTSLHEVFTATLLDPKALETKDGKATKYAPSNLVTVSVKIY